jgi:ribonuclease PH
MELLGPRTITVDCDVLQADGGTRTASITGGYVALTLAIRKLVAANAVAENTIRPAVAAVSVGVVGGVPMVDLCYEEDSAAEVDFNVVMTGEDAFVEVQGTAEREPFSQATLDELLRLARKGIGELFVKQAAALAG